VQVDVASSAHVYTVDRKTSEVRCLGEAFAVSHGTRSADRPSATAAWNPKLMLLAIGGEDRSDRDARDPQRRGVVAVFGFP
jgi:hypothetical protein